MHIFHFIVAALLGFASASSFLSRGQGEALETMDAELQSTIMQKINEMLDQSSVTMQARLQRIQDQLHTTFKAMPKNDLGKLDHDAVRYTLHSYFVQRHGWYVRGLSNVGESFNATASDGTLQDRVEEFIQGVFEQKLGAHGLNLHEMSTLVATFENLVHEEVVQRLDSSLKALRMPGVQEFQASQVDEVLDAYMMSYITRIDYSRVRPGAIDLLRQKISTLYPSWEETRSFMREVRERQGGHHKFYSRSAVESILEDIGDQYGRWQDKECQELKAKLVRLEDRTIGVNGSGRVRLSDFYRSSLKDGNWQFIETQEFLAQSGILDLHDSNIPRLVIPNYINSPSNCLAGSKYYSVCCINDCEDLLDSLEHRFKAPAVPTAEILAAVSSLASSSVSAGRTVQPMLVKRLEEIASHHGGVVPLHGRLFAQWMHHAYPRECPYPHMSGTIRPQRTREFGQESGRSATHNSDALEKEHNRLVAAQQATDGTEGEECTEWSMEEELYVVGALEGGASKGPLRALAYMAICLTVLLTIGRHLRSSSTALGLVSPVGGKDFFV